MLLYTIEAERRRTASLRLSLHDILKGEMSLTRLDSVTCHT